MIYLKVATAATVHIGPFVDSTDGFTAETGLDVTSTTIRISANGGAWGAADASATHSSNGYYTAVLDATDTATLGRLNLACNITGALPVFQTYHVISAHVFDTLFSTDTFNVNVVEWNSTAAVEDAVANIVAPANLASLAIDTSGDVQSLPVLITTGTGAGQLDVDSGICQVNVAQWASSATSTGQMARLTASTSIAAVGVNLVNIAGAAVSTGAGQLGVNAFEIGGTAQTGRDIGANVLISSGTGAGQISFSSGGIPLVNISSGTGAGQLINTDGVVTANVTFWNSTAVAANSLANLTAFSSANFTTGTREYLWSGPGANSAITHTLMLDRVYSHFFNKMTITDASGEIVLRNAADDGDLGTATITDDDTDTVRSSMTFT